MRVLEAPPDYLAMEDRDAYAACGADATKWVEFFCQIKDAQGWSAFDIDADLMGTWFASAMMAMHDFSRAAA